MVRVKARLNRRLIEGVAQTSIKDWKTCVKNLFMYMIRLTRVAVAVETSSCSIHEARASEAAKEIIPFDVKVHLDHTIILGDLQYLNLFPIIISDGEGGVSQTKIVFFMFNQYLVGVIHPVRTIVNCLKWKHLYQ